MANCRLPIRMATGDAFSDEEIDDILTRLKGRFDFAGKSAAERVDAKAQMAAAAADMTRSELKRLLIEQRLEVAAEVARDARRRQIDGMGGGMDEADRLRAYSVGSEKQGLATSSSVDAEGIARSVSLMAQVDRGLKADPSLMGRLSNFWGLGERGFDRKVAAEMARLSDETVKPTGDAGAELAAKVLSGALERSRQMQNAAGAFIEKAQGYIARQSHDRLKVSGGFWREFEGLASRVKAEGAGALDWNAMRLAAQRKAFRAWRDFIRPRLDEHTFAGLDPGDIDKQGDAAALHANGVIDDPADLKERFLYRVWSDIVSGKREAMTGASDAGDFTPSPSKARSVSQARVLHFTSPDAWMDYHERYGKGSLMASVLGQLNRAGRNTALMSKWGPAPEAAFNNEVARLIEEARGRGDTGAMTRLQDPMRAAEFGQVTGANNVADNLRLAMIGKAIRLDQSLSKLGGVVLSQLGTDEALAAQSFKRMGATWLDGYRNVWSGIARLNGAEARKAADLCDVMGRASSQHLMGLFHAGDGPLGWGAWAGRLLMRVTGSEALASGHHVGVAVGIAAHLGEQAKFAWDALHAGTRETLERFGIEPAAWDLIRQGAYQAGDDRHYLTFDALDHVKDEDALAYGGFSGKAKTPEAAQGVRDGLRLRLQTMVNNIIDDTIPHARAREQVGLTRGLKPGTIFGEAIRIATQFWGFHSSVMGRHLAPSARGFAGQSPVALLAHLVLATTLGGAFSLEAKQIASGRTPRPFVDENGNFDPKIWLASALQGGGLGIYGDFLFGEANRNGQKFGIENLAGPGVGELESLAQLVRSAVSGNEEHLPAMALGFGARNMPFANVWYTRIALDYLILWRLQEAVSPGYLARHEQRLEAQQHTQSLLAPAGAQ